MLAKDKVKYEVVTIKRTFKFEGKYRGDLESDNWHYYELSSGTLLHLRKEHMICVIGDSATNLIINKILKLKNNKENKK